MCTGWLPVVYTREDVQRLLFQGTVTPRQFENWMAHFRMREIRPGAANEGCPVDELLGYLDREACKHRPVPAQSLNDCLWVQA